MEKWGFLPLSPLDDLEKGQRNNGFIKRSPAKAGQGAQKVKSEAPDRCAATTKLERNAAGGLFTRPSLFDDQTVAGGHPVESSAVNSKDFGCLFFISPCLLQDLLNVEFLQFGQRKVGRKRPGEVFLFFGTDTPGQVFRQNDGMAGKGNGPLDYIFQFSHIPGPAVRQ